MFHETLVIRRKNPMRTITMNDMTFQQNSVAVAALVVLVVVVNVVSVVVHDVGALAM